MEKKGEETESIHSSACWKSLWVGNNSIINVIKDRH